MCGRTLYRSEERRDVLRDRNKGLVQRLAQLALEHELQLVVEQLREVRTHGGRQHADALEDGLQRRRTFLSA